MLSYFEKNMLVAKSVLRRYLDTDLDRKPTKNLRETLRD
jgi:hypothetical protein